jgi:uncharacterized damage-inducible protein DinB
MKISGYLAFGVWCFVFVIASRVIAQDRLPFPAVAPMSGIRSEFLANVEETESKFVKLAEAVPAEKYAWRPEKGVRSFSEVFAHVAASNYSLPRLIGATPPSNLPRDMEKMITEKSKVIETLKQSFQFLKQAALNLPDSALDTQANFFGQQTSKRGVLLNIATHMHEHLGQSIAYARMNGIVPPWSAGTQ